MAISLNSISKSSGLPERILLHSAPGIGKSTWAAMSDRPIFIQTEDGLSGLPEVETFPLAKSFDEVMEAISALYLEQHEYKTVVIDSADWLEMLIVQKVCDDEKVQSIEKISYGRGHVFAMHYWRNIIDGLNALRNDRQMSVIMLCHTDVKRVSDPTMPEYDTNTLKLHKRASAILEEWADIILYATVQTNTVTEESGFSGKRTRAVTTGQRIVHTVGQPAFLAKSRFTLPPILPLDWQAFDTALKAAKRPVSASQAA
jgi:hypothetical protein